MKALIRSYFLVLIILISGCDFGTRQPEPILCKPTVVFGPVRDIPPTVLPYVEDFELLALFYGKEVPNNLIVLFLEDQEWPGNRVGLCLNYTGTTPIVFLKPAYWWRVSDLQRRYLIYHELGHCFLRYGHTETDPHDIMFPQLGRVTESMLDLYIIKLFTGKYPRLRD